MIRMPRTRLPRLLTALDSRRRLLVVSHNNPDPDAIASAWGIKRLLDDGGNREVRMGYAGLLGRAENRALVGALGEPLLRVEELEAESFDGVLLVDCQPGAGNVMLPAGLPVVAVFDHHPRSVGLRGIPFADVRTSFGSCTALVFEYWKEKRLLPDRLTATAFYYAIRSETQELGREAGHHDRRLFQQLAQAVDWALLHRIVHAPAPRSYYATFKMALERARLYGDALFADAGELPIPDAAAEIADWLLRLDEVHWALACGTYRGRLLFSLRSLVIGAHCGAISQRIVEGWGTAGGHGMMAGGQVQLERRLGYDRGRVILQLEQRYVDVMGYSGTTPTLDPFAIVPGRLTKA